MKFIETDTHIEQAAYFTGHASIEQLLFFDIETTGFAAVATKLYFIGCMYYKDHSWKIGQWFNDDGASECAMLTEFTDFIQQFRYFVHFNGDGFDIPYIHQKCEHYNIIFNTENIQSIDLYKWIRPYKKLLSLPNLKLKTIETFLGIDRTDTYSGGELIAVYDRYLQTGDESLFSLLFQHNYEDIKNMLCISDIAYYKDFFEGNVSDIQYTSEADAVKISFQASLPKKLALTKQRITLTANTKEAVIKIPLYRGELRLFFENYKDYFYLPVEDTAIHKSVAVYMDKDYRRRATKDTCYQRVNGSFLPSFDYPAEKTYGASYKERHSFLDTALIEESSFSLAEYTDAVLKWFTK